MKKVLIVFLCLLGVLMITSCKSDRKDVDNNQTEEIQNVNTDNPPVEEEEEF
jgi:hypothetical protein